MIPGGYNKQIRILFKDGSTWCGTGQAIYVYADSQHEQRVVVAGPGLLYVNSQPVQRVFVGRI